MNSLSFSTIELLAQEGGNPLGFLILLLPIAAIIFLTVMPQRRQRAKQAQVLKSLEVGEEVVTIGGIVGVINFLEDDLVHLEIDDDVVLRLTKGSISGSTTVDPDAKPEGGLSKLSAMLGGGAAANATKNNKGGDDGAESTNGSESDDEG